MIILINGATHSGKKLLAQKLLEKYKYPYLSIDHLKMGLIRSGNTTLTPCDDDKLLPFLWNIVKEIIKTAIENNQNLIVEGAYIPFDFKDSFSKEYLEHIKYICIVFSENYINENFDEIIKNRSVIENRLYENELTKEFLIDEHKSFLYGCKKYSLDYILVDENYDVTYEI